jgi:hypothetical protein
MADVITTTGTTAPWAAQQPYLTQGFQAAQNEFLTQGANGNWTANALEWYSDPETESTSTVSPMGFGTRRQIRNITNLANNRNILNPAERYAAQAIRGNYLTADTNPYLADMVEAASQAAREQFTTQTIPGLSSKFGMSGRTGSPGMMNAYDSAAAGYGRGVADIATNLYGTAYENERQRQQEMAMFAPDLLQARTGMYSSALEAQQLRDEQAQRELTDRVNRFNFLQKAPGEAIANYMRNVSGQYGGQETKQQPVFEPSTLSQVLGGLTAAQQSGLLGAVTDFLGGLFGGNP